MTSTDISARRDTAGTVHAEVMNAGTDREFIRIFLTCPMGHDLGSLPLESALQHPFHVNHCTHYEHKAEAAA